MPSQLKERVPWHNIDTTRSFNSSPFTYIIIVHRLYMQCNRSMGTLSAKLLPTSFWRSNLALPLTLAVSDSGKRPARHYMDIVKDTGSNGYRQPSSELCA